MVYFISNEKDLIKKVAVDIAFNRDSLEVTEKRIKEIQDNSVVVMSPKCTALDKDLKILNEKNCYIIAYINTPLEQAIVTGKSCIIGGDVSTLSLVSALKSLGIKLSDDEESLPFYFGKSKTMQDLKESANKARRGNVSVHISGEIGSGKSSLARYIAGNKKLVSLNCSCLDQSLVLDTLFGHKEGAYTGALGERKGLCREADNAILFLDEIQDLSPSIQAMLLDVIETGYMRPLGSDKQIKVKFKLITASSLPLEELKKAIRADLYSRIGVIKLTVPPLRDRKEDIESLFDLKLKELKKQGPGYDVYFSKKFLTYDWPNNIRELNQKIEYLYTMGGGDKSMDKGKKRKKDENKGNLFDGIPKPEELIKFLKDIHPESKEH